MYHYLYIIVNYVQIMIFMKHCRRVRANSIPGRLHAWVWLPRCAALVCCYGWPSDRFLLRLITHHLCSIQKCRTYANLHCGPWQTSRREMDRPPLPLQLICASYCQVFWSTGTKLCSGTWDRPRLMLCVLNRHRLSWSKSYWKRYVLIWTLYWVTWERKWSLLQTTGRLT